MTRRLPNLKHLRAFEAAARHLSFKQAANELSVTQAAISHQIKALEEHFGARLFHRLNRQVALTEEAAVLAAELELALDQVASASARFRAQVMTGTIRISVTPFYANRMILPHLEEFHAAFPGLSVDLELSYEIADFAERDLDGALRYGLSDRPGAYMQLIHLDRVAPVTSPALIHGNDLPMTPAQIAEFPLAAVAGQERYWSQWFKAAGRTLSDDCKMSRHDQRALALDFALAGNAVALADLPLIRNELANGSLVCLSETQITLDRGIHLAVPEGPFRDPRLTAFGDWLRGRISEWI
ncbi:LysR substrate-binding domain-containing protein [Pseudophaeobacter flagellatus]|uniref:LysR substrate-binding domain-containing protein n=1 Tax=Pseudophaeobacter flagellatus TaxID=2899119 RepID=UPI001E5BB701|nr:LysR substrate-binding domain-containing protein [Pseudophaeobacter flagellatus]MCD9150116.1 LysR substrate-binding domain-containing protein [Pseudophaeobacter flagellatus]